MPCENNCGLPPLTNNPSNDVLDTFRPAIHDIERKTESIENLALVARAEDSTFLLPGIRECRKKVTALTRLLSGKAEDINSLAECCSGDHSIRSQVHELRHHLSDIHDQVVTMISDLDHCEEMLARSHSDYLVQLGVSSIGKGNRAKRALSKITLVPAILTALNVICGLFGMNVDVPARNTVGLQWFFGISGGIATATVFCLVLVKWMKYI